MRKRRPLNFRKHFFHYSSVFAFILDIQADFSPGRNLSLQNCVSIHIRRFIHDVSLERDTCVKGRGWLLNNSFLKLNRGYLQFYVNSKKNKNNSICNRDVFSAEILSSSCIRSFVLVLALHS